MQVVRHQQMSQPQGAGLEEGQAKGTDQTHIGQPSGVTTVHGCSWLHTVPHSTPQPAQQVLAAVLAGVLSFQPYPVLAAMRNVVSSRIARLQPHGQVSVAC